MCREDKESGMHRNTELPLTRSPYQTDRLVVSQTIDVVFVVDKSSSMGPAQAQLRNNAPLIFDTLQIETGGDFRVALVAYGGGGTVDGQEISEVVKYLSFTNDRDAFVDAFNALQNTGGAELAYDALTQTITDTIILSATSDGTFLEGMPQPTGSFPRPWGFCPFLVTDVESNNDAPGNNVDSVRDLLVSTNSVFYGFTRGSLDYDSLAEATGGQRGQLVDLLNDPVGTIGSLLLECVSMIMRNSETLVTSTPTVGPNTLAPRPTVPTPNGMDSICPTAPLSCSAYQSSSSQYTKGKGKGSVPSMKKGRTYKGKGGGIRKHARRGLMYDYPQNSYYKGNGKGNGSDKGSYKSSDRTGKGKKSSSGKISHSDVYPMVPGVAICYYDSYKHVYTTECVDPNDEYFLNIYSEEQDYTCGCCTPDIESSGMLPDYCSLRNYVSHTVESEFSDEQSSWSTVVSARQYSSPATQKVEPLSVYECMEDGDNYQVCGRSDVFVYRDMYAMCRYDVKTRNYNTLCVHHTMRDEIIEDSGGRYSCGCCDTKDEHSSSPSYCQM
eukprot:scaffold11094_cov176-Amphora_coffeaeformis.AAC.3